MTEAADAESRLVTYRAMQAGKAALASPAKLKARELFGELFEGGSRPSGHEVSVFDAIPSRTRPYLRKGLKP
ncbi:MAG TPA: hypothetical protein VGF39_04290 [Stellaceae bacterium]